MSEKESTSKNALARVGQSLNILAGGDNQGTSLARIDARIADPNTPLPEAIELTSIRRELIRQDERRLDRIEARRSRARQFWGKLGFSLVAVGTGVGLVAFGLNLEGFMIMGIGFHWLAPGFVKGIFDRALGGREKNDED